MHSTDVVAALRKRHPPGKWVFLTEVRTATGYGGKDDTEVSPRFIDCFAMALWPSEGFKRIAYEVKVSRADFLSELEHPAKRFQARALSHEFWYAVAPGVYDHIQDWPKLDGCGVIEVHANGSRILARHGKGWVPMGMPESFVASLLRNAAKESLVRTAGQDVVEEAMVLFKMGYDGPMMGEDIAPFYGACIRYDAHVHMLGKDLHMIHPTAQISYVVGDATRPIHTPAFILHACNDVGVWARGFVKSLSNRWPGPEAAYRASAKELGTISLSEPEPGVVVVNMVCQRGVDEDRHIDPLALERCLAEVNHLLEAVQGELPSVHCPRIGTGLGQTPWAGTEAAIRYGLPSKKVYVYDLR